MFEELLEAGHKGAEYDAWLIKIFEGEQFWSGFVDINPNSKIPAMLDRSGPTPFRGVRERLDPVPPGREVRRPACPRSTPARAETHELADVADGQRAVHRRRLRPFLRLCARSGSNTPIDRYAMETKRLFAPRSTRSWPRPSTSPATTTRSPTSPPTPGSATSTTAPTTAATCSSSLDEYENVGRWASTIDARPGAIRGRLVNAQSGLPERHSAKDFDTLDKELFDPVRKRAGLLITGPLPCRGEAIGVRTCIAALHAVNPRARLEHEAAGRELGIVLLVEQVARRSAVSAPVALRCRRARRPGPPGCARWCCRRPTRSGRCGGNRAREQAEKPSPSSGAILRADVQRVARDERRFVADHDRIGELLDLAVGVALGGARARVARQRPASPRARSRSILHLGHVAEVLGRVGREEDEEIAVLRQRGRIAAALSVSGAFEPAGA